MNSTTDAGVKALKLLAKHAEVIVRAYETQNCYIMQSEESAKTINELFKFDLVVQDDNSALYRLNSSVKELLDQALKTSRLKIVNADIGAAIDGIRDLIRAYNEAKFANRAYDTVSMLSSLESNVSDLCDSLKQQSRNIWRQIDSDFGSVTSLSGKLLLNNNALDKIRLLLKSLDNIDFRELMASCNRDTELRKIINVRLSRSLDIVRNDLNVSLQRLNKTLFKLKKLKERAKLVNTWVNQFQQNPGYRIPDFTSSLDVHYIFKRPLPVVITGAMDVKNPVNEDFLSDLIKDIRKTPPADENLLIVQTSADIQEIEEEELQISPFLAAIRELYYQCLVTNLPVSASDSFVSKAPDGTELHLWINGVVAEYNAMPEHAKSSFDLRYVGEFDPVFTGNFNASDVVICPV